MSSRPPQVYTVSNESVLAEFIPFATPKLKFYKQLDTPYSSFHSLAQHITGLKNKHVKSLREDSADESLSKKISRLCEIFLFCLAELGLWLGLKATEFLSAENEVIFWGPKRDTVGDRIVSKFCQDVFQVFSTYVPSGLKWSIGGSVRENVNVGFLTDKVNCLIESLLEYSMIKDLRCIIFVERIITAIVLQSLLSQLPQLCCWKTAYMAGNHSGLQSQSRAEQIKIIEAFHVGKVNIIVATQILEEGLDVQNCNLVIRFDPSATVCSFIQSRGRARMRGSEYLLMIKSGDDSTLSRVKNYLASGDIMRKESLSLSSIPCVPFESEMSNEEFYRVEATGAIVTLSSSVALIYYYCSQLPSDRYFRPTPRFVIDKESKSCTLHLPLSCPIQSVLVDGKADILKKIACLEACKKLHQIGALTDNLIPYLVVEEADAQEFSNTTYDDEQVNYFPAELVNHCPSCSVIEMYHCYVIRLKKNFKYDVPFRDIALLVRHNLGADFENFYFDLEVDWGFVTVNLVYNGTIHLSPDQVLMARRFQITVLRVLIDHSMDKVKDVMDETFQKQILPIVDYILLPFSDNTKCFDWEYVIYDGNDWGKQMHYCRCRSNVHWMHTINGIFCRCMLVNSLVLTPHNGHIYCITHILDDLDANSPMKCYKCKNEDEGVPSYMDYYRSRHGVGLLYEMESLLSGRHIFTVKNWLQRSKHRKEKEPSGATVELPSELCVIILSPLPIDILHSFSLVPSIMHRIESMLLALNLKKLQLDHYMQNVIIPLDKILEAITTKKCEEQFSLESLETLGDSFLKYAVSQQLFKINNHDHEGLLSAKKDRMVSNATLCKLGCDHKLTGFIRNELFDPKLWAIPNDHSTSHEFGEELLSDTRKIYFRGKRRMKNKVVADAVEALIGAYLETGGEVAALIFMDWLGIEVTFVHIPHEKPFLGDPKMHINIRHIESLLKYSFRDPSLLVEALTHGSYMIPEIPRCYQRLEFLGDSVLDYLITTYLYNKYPGASPGLLTDLRSASVNNDSYANAALKAGLHKHILHASPKLHQQISSILNYHEQINLGPTIGWDSEMTFPKVLGDVIESLAGAILVDSEYNKDVVWKSMQPLLEPIVTPDTVKLHPVRELHELCQRHSYVMKPYSVSYKEGLASITIEVEAYGITYSHTCTGENKKTAKRLACKAVLGSLKARMPKI
ncbi:PREDICTED: endoribonuclease Dicer homolog 2 isoform X2 [Nelumbo nucifera]|uniref:Endoribonuclease Dicer homolog 2 isoform X2 n=1 Tax=Nelumbo nucifera TaxID=4432 RepID=A0A1U7ZLQ2_NELNU|nr:PREDICTED: endoribonuclease Dicer homolog 2 isoform X2 [Nelumbo nucifera]